MLAALALLPVLPFVDDGKADLQFAQFRTNLVNAIKKENFDWAIARIDPEVKVSFGGNDGKQELLESWENDRDAEKRFFDELLKCIELGGQFKTYDTKRYFVAPYVFSSWPEEFDAFEHVAVIGKDRAVFATPDATTTPVAMLAFNIVKRTYEADQQDGWAHIEYDTDKWGWIDEGSVRSPIAHRAFFEKKPNSSYYLVTFVAGD